MIRVGLKNPEMPKLIKINTSVYLENFSLAHLNWEINQLEERAQKKMQKPKK